MIKELVINDKLNLLVLHSKFDSNRELILVENNSKLNYILEEMENKTHIKIDRNVKWLPIRDIIKLISHLPPDIERYYCGKLLETLVYFRSTTTKETVKLPIYISSDLMYIVGVIIGDGSLFDPKTKKTYPVYICGTNEKYFKKVIRPLMKSLFGLDYFPNGKYRKNKKILYEWYVSRKSLRRYLSLFFEIPLGKKSHNVRVPKIVYELSKEKQISFLAGLMDTDWGYEYYLFGTGSASKMLLEDTKQILTNNFNINNLRIFERIINDRFKSYSMSVPRPEIIKFSKIFKGRLKNKDRVQLLEKLIGKLPSSSPVKDPGLRC